MTSSARNDQSDLFNRKSKHPGLGELGGKKHGSGRPSGSL